MHKSSVWSVIAHGGAKDIAPGEETLNRAGLEEAIATGTRMLEAGADAIDVVREVVKLLELNPAYNAGLYGSVINEDGEIEMDASIMDGATLDIGAVAGLQDVEHPVEVAHALLRDRAIFLAGNGAMKFARSLGAVRAEKYVPTPTSSPGCDTVGCVARDRKGNIAAATSTGGLGNKRTGRIGDVPMPGCGFYAENALGGVSASGDGEHIARSLLASRFLQLAKEKDATAAATEALDVVARIQGEAGLIAIQPDGTLVWAHNSSHFAVGMAQEGDAKPRVYLQKIEEHENAS